MIKAVLFDLDGTLLNRDASVVKFAENQYERLHSSLGHIPKNTYVSRFIELDNHGYVWKDKVYQILVKEFTISGLTWEDLLQDYLQYFKESCVAFPHLLPMLDELQKNGLILGMITNGKGQFQMDNIRALGIEDYLDAILISECEGLKKPNPEIFKKALGELDVSPTEAIFVGDHPLNDIKAAQNVGMKSIWKRNHQQDKVKADFTIEGLEEIAFIMRAYIDSNFSNT